MRRRVVITGMGVITPLGDTVGELFAACAAGKSGVGPITRFDARTFPTTFAAEVKGFDLGRYVRGPERWKDAGEASQFAAAAARLALEDAGLLDLAGVDPTRFGVYLGTGEGTQDFPVLTRMAYFGYQPGSAPDHLAMSRTALADYRPRSEYEQELHTPSAHLAEQFGLEGPNYSCLTACAAGTQALGEALEVIRQGEGDRLLAGGAHSMIHPLGVTGFNLLTALSTHNADPPRASRPFDLRRDGFVLGEGAALLVLEELEHARRR